MIKDKKILIFGLGVEGTSAANYFADQNDVTIFDEKKKNKIDKIFFDLLKSKNIKHYFATLPAKIPKFDYIIRSAGVRPDNPKLKSFSSKKTQITSSTKYFFGNCPCPIIGVTGTKGKGTTSTLIYEIIKKSGKKVFLAGNIGTPMLDVLPKITRNNLVVLELSSFQLMDLERSPHIAVVLMVTSEHLDWHKDQNEYIKAKENLVKHQKKSDYAVVNVDFEKSLYYSKETAAFKLFFSTVKKTNGVYVDNDFIISNIKGREKICAIKDVLLPGRHNLQNICASIAVAKILNIKNKIIINVIKTFKGLSHRLEKIADIKGVDYYNDSFSTTPETTIAAINAFENPKVLILGGSSKHSDFSFLAKEIAKSNSIRKIILIGQEANHLNNVISQNGKASLINPERPKNMKEIVSLSKSLAKKGDIVLLSPACASFDMFKNYKDRGEQFVKEVKKLAANKT